MKPKPCKWCDSIWHSKNKCKLAPEKPSKTVYRRKSPKVPPTSQNASERPRLAHKGNSERSQLIGWADKYFSIYIRNRGADGDTNICFTCYVRLPIDDLHCGHFMARRYMNTRWHELNCWPQCNDCNVVKNGNLKVYETRLRSLYGNDAIDELMQLARSTDKFSIIDIKSVVERYKGVVFF